MTFFTYIITILTVLFSIRYETNFSEFNLFFPIMKCGNKINIITLDKFYFLRSVICYNSRGTK